MEMSIKIFYNFCLKDVDKTDLSGDILTGVRESYFRDFARIRDKITTGSGEQPFFYDFALEKEKPMKWTVKNASGVTTQEVMLSDNGKYYLYFYVEQALYKRILFSKLHTLLKIEYFETATGVVRYTLEPRKSQNGLCILMTVKSKPQPIPLFDAPDARDDRIRERIRTEFTDYTVEASTDDGLARFYTEEQLAKLRLFIEKCEQDLANIEEESFVGGDTPLLDKISAKDFNVKRNLSSSLDITQAMEFGVHEEPQESPAEPEEASVPTETDPVVEADENTEEPVTVPVEEVPDEAEEEETPAAKPDKLIMADGAVYSYYGELDAQGNRSGYGRTLTETGRTAYEGCYYNDKRSGVGSYYYKNGTLCYSGDWLENARHGVGVGVSSHDGSIHVGNWKNNKPEGSGVRLTAQGDIKFVCKELSDGTTVLMNYMPDDTVLISKYDEKGKKIGESTMSLRDVLR